MSCGQVWYTSHGVSDKGMSGAWLPPEGTHCRRRAGRTNESALLRASWPSRNRHYSRIRPQLRSAAVRTDSQPSHSGKTFSTLKTLSVFSSVSNVFGWAADVMRTSSRLRRMSACVSNIDTRFQELRGKQSRLDISLGVLQQATAPVSCPHLLLRHRACRRQ